MERLVTGLGQRRPGPATSQVAPEGDPRNAEGLRIRDDVGVVNPPFWIVISPRLLQHAANLSPKNAVPQDDFRSAAEFSQRVDRLAAHLKIALRRLPQTLGISERMLFAYRKGSHPITAKAWAKLRQAEIAAGLAVADEPRAEESPARFDPADPLSGHATPVPRGQHSPAGRGVIAPHESFSKPPLPTEADVHAYVAYVLSVAAGDPRRLATLLETLQLHLEPWIRKWSSD